MMYIATLPKISKNFITHQVYVTAKEFKEIRETNWQIYNLKETNISDISDLPATLQLFHFTSPTIDQESAVSYFSRANKLWDIRLYNGQYSDDAIIALLNNNPQIKRINIRDSPVTNKALNAVTNNS